MNQKPADSVTYDKWLAQGTEAQDTPKPDENEEYDPTAGEKTLKTDGVSRQEKGLMDAREEMALKPRKNTDHDRSHKKRPPTRYCH